ncbi:efflux RND transporter periplasmic adaptor subunit [Marinilabiliaceae bacterium ANBcel2]|nr:efflux RND transporter periplasmic adaptor subunit [Marinilabiliaceae bacterium ANBcel2]
MILKKSTEKLRRNRNITLGVVLVLLIIIVAVPQFRREFEEEPDTAPYYKVEEGIFIPQDSPVRESLEIATVGTQKVSRVISAPASVEANPAQKAGIYPPVGGKIVRLFVNLGEEVQKGQPLFELYSPEIADIQTSFISARSSLAQATSELNRKKELHDRGITPLRELEEAQTAYEIAESEMQGVTMTMDIMGIDKSDLGQPLQVRTPVKGRVVDLSAAPGEFISDPEDPVMIIADLSNVWVTANIQEQDIRFVSRGTKAEATFPAWPGEEYSGEVLFVSDMLDEETRTAKVRVEFDNSDYKLKPGMFANVRFQSPKVHSFVLPSKAVLQRRDFNYVYVETAPYTFEQRRVKVGDMVDDKLVILDGLNYDEKVIVDNAVLLP